jgi:hypothetical protein
LPALHRLQPLRRSLPFEVLANRVRQLRATQPLATSYNLSDFFQLLEKEGPPFVRDRFWTPHLFTRIDVILPDGTLQALTKDVQNFLPFFESFLVTPQNSEPANY